MKWTTGRSIVLVLMVTQVILFSMGVWLLVNGELGYGLFNTIVNAVFFVVNLHSLRLMSS